ncbi:MAG: hypothetical protein EZS28_045274 [Streblomastix strix]|uniref:Uncharacterized protein n=1 Tax=Streblomastix strix TaxID=222440 RepID=A0A5J4TMJ4_9EUKA|nr:MAG: hypothetical protein EZS28_045274 [Streblomastix strix]
MEAIFLGPYCYGGTLKELQIKAILIKSDSSTAVQDLAKQRAGETLVAEVKKIVKLCQQLRKQTHIQHIIGISNKITDALSRLSNQGDYSVKKRDIHRSVSDMVDTSNTGDLLATKQNKLVDRFIAINESDEGPEWINAFSRSWKEEIFWFLLQIPKLGKAMIASNMFKPKAIIIAP